MIELRFRAHAERFRIGEEPSFGSQGDFRLTTSKDPGPTGKFFYAGGVWWLANLVDRTSIEVHDETSRTRISLAPRRATPVGFSAFRLSVAISGERFDLAGSIQEGRSTTLSAVRQPPAAAATAEPVMDRLRADEQRLLANRKVTRILDAVCATYAGEGVGGLVGSTGRPAASRREILARHLLVSGELSETEIRRQLSQEER